MQTCLRYPAAEVANHALIRANLRLVVSVAKRISGAAFPSDLIQEGNLVCARGG